MAARRTGRNSWLTILLVVVAFVLWLRDQRKPSPDSPSKPPPSAAEHTGAYETFHGCTLAEARGNDGDSFEVRLPGGRQEVFRLYFVDTPESAFKRYRGGDTNHSRIVSQAKDLGGITPEQAVRIGGEAKHFTLARLSRGPFTLHTSWDSPYQDQRYHAFIETGGGGTRWLHEELVKRGLARILTKPADLPDGTTAAKQLEKLRSFERQARASKAGAWGL